MIFIFALLIALGSLLHLRVQQTRQSIQHVKRGVPISPLPIPSRYSPQTLALMPLPVLVLLLPTIWSLLTMVAIAGWIWLQWRHLEQRQEVLRLLVYRNTHNE